MSKTKSLGDRMKEYEFISRIKLQKNSWIVIRIDGKAFHTYTRGFDKPFDNKMIGAMRKAMEYVSDSMSGFVIGYTQSDECSIILTDTFSNQTEPYFDNNLQKLVSISSSMFTYEFNRIMKNVHKHTDKPALFDSRAFTIPKEEVPNYLIWRQRDWNKNSIQMLARSYYSTKQLHKKNGSDMHEMLFKKGCNWAKIQNIYKNGTFYFGDDLKSYHDKYVYSDLELIIENILKSKTDKHV